ncbi:MULTISPECIES: phage integrase family protein [unclassified Burkholderia]|uniref:phage integrase family protein n=1 Tax=unclassified Burkholderia TaxID=2613784 RepID=UPI00075AD7D9|nr:MULTISPECIES: phage integrase family protein [unclassified Burkholderia]KVN19060.1 hypothetical protein WT08_00765 [Burkholderia sp. MSMB1552]KWZ47024.1 hypothetical protein WS92_30285 [Burkholderia sp. MSMB1588]
MVNRPQQLEQLQQRTYSRTKFTALRARVKGLSIATIARLYFDPDTTTHIDIERLLRTMRDDLVAAALRNGSSVLVSHLQAAIAKYGEPRLTPVTLQLIEQVAGRWAVAARLAGEGIHTLGELVALVNRRGGQWWRSVPRIGVGRARVLVAWLRTHAASIGTAVAYDVDAGDALAPTSWLLEVIGKGNKQRFVPISDDCVDALRAHWGDRGLDFDAAAGPPDLPLIAPLVVPPTLRARAKFGAPNDADAPAASPATRGYSVRGARGLTQWAIAQLLEPMPELSEAERRKLAGTSPHAFRHTVGTQMLAAGVALEVVQRTLGHASLGTTSIYVSPEEARMRREAAKYHARLARER